ncbi:MAG: hypothetical protein ACE5R4_06055 [Armatimonadota bacterium]
MACPETDTHEAQDGLSHRRAQHLTAEEAKHLVLHRWLYWGVVPLVGCFVLAVIAGLLAAPSELSHIKLADVFAGFLAVGAGAFLLGFAIDGHMTNPERLAALADYELPEDRKKDDPIVLPAHPAIRRQVVKCASVLSALGAVMGLAAIIHLAFGGEMGQGMQLIVLGAAYQLFLLSRHDHYSDLIEGSPDARR